jgi:ADP-heptose:LPS heptosyltransferase
VNPAHKNDHNRSIGLAELIKHLPPGVQYVSLQQIVSDADQRVLTGYPEILHLGHLLKDFSDTAALCELMDLVVSVDTSVAHLSGALGRPTWILLPYVPDWRWMLNREDSPWYPSVKLYRQATPGEWNHAFERVREVLSSLK